MPGDTQSSPEDAGTAAGVVGGAAEVLVSVQFHSSEPSRQSTFESQRNAWNIRYRKIIRASCFKQLVPACFYVVDVAR